MPDRPLANSDRWEQLASCFEAALLLTAPDRDALIRRTFPDDEVARDELSAMLRMNTADEALALEPRLLATMEDIGAAPPDVIGSYRVTALIGRGGMGEVYRAERADDSFGQVVAIKVLRRELLSPELVARFHRERRILATLTHPGVVGLIDGGTTTDGRPYLVMPLVTGHSIVDYATRHCATLESRLRLFLEVTQAVQHLHTQLVVHRDLKPSNIVVTEAGVVQLLDFGIAKLLASTGHALPAVSASEAPDTRSHIRLFTPEYAAPEQLRGEPVTTATDVYALGVVLYQLLAGTRPHIAASRSVHELEQEILTAEPNPPSAAGWQQPWARALRGDLDRIILMAMRKEPERRYQSVAQFAEDIERHLQRLPVRAQRDTFRYRAGKFMRRNRVAMLIGGASLAMLLAFTAGAVRQAILLKQERDRAQRQTASAEQVVALLTSFFEQSDPLISPGGDTLRVSQLLAFAEQCADSLTADPVAQARIRRTIGRLRLLTGDVAPARRLLSQAYAQLLAAPDIDSLEVFRLYHELARAVDGVDGHVASFPLFDTTVMRFRRSLPETAHDLDVALRELALRTADVRLQQRLLDSLADGGTLRDVTSPMERAERIHALPEQRLDAGRILEATALFEETLRIVDSLLPRDSPARQTVFGNVASARRFGGEFDVAARLALQRLAEQRARRPPYPRDLAGATEGLAAIQAERGFLEDAERLEREALARWRDALAPTHPSVAFALLNMAFITSSRGQTILGVAYMDSAVAVMRAGGAPETAMLPFLDRRAEMLLRASRWDEADNALQALTPSIDRHWPPGHRLQNVHLLNRAVLALARDDNTKARALFDSATSLMTPLVPPTYPMLQQATCGRAVANARLVKQPAGSVQSRCAEYRRYGIPVAPLLAWADAIEPLPTISPPE